MQSGLIGAMPKLSNVATPKPLALKNEAGKFVLPADGKFQLVPKGNAPNFLNDTDGKCRKIMQVVDEVALTSMRDKSLARATELESQGLPAETPICYFHNEKEASGWVQLRSAEIRPDGLYFEVKLTNEGEDSLTSGKLRFFSPNFPVSSCVTIGNEGNVEQLRPMELSNDWLGSLTNNHNFRQLKPLSNESQAAEASDNQPAQNDMKYSQAFIEGLIKAGLLSNEKSKDEAAVSTAAEAALIKLSNQSQQLADAAAAQLAGDMEKFKNVIPAGQEAFIKQMLQNDRTAAINYLEAAAKAVPAEKAKEEQTRLTNGTHKGNELPGKMINDHKAQQTRAADQTKLVNEIMKEIGPDSPGAYNRAWNMAATRNPDLFAEQAE